MQYTTLGNTGLVVSRMAFGAMTFTAGNKEMSSVYKVGAKLADELVGRSLEAGINFFDTADVYANGESETLLGQALKSRRSDVVIATKVGSRMGTPITQSGLSRRHIFAALDASLKRLQTDWIDVYIVHREDSFTPIEETLDALDAVVRAGKVRYIGYSNWSAWKAAAAMEIQRANRLAQFTHGQMYYSLLGRDVERDIIPMMKRYGLGLTVWSPLASGFLSGKYTSETLKDPDGRYAGFDFLPFDKNAGFKLIERMRAMSAAHKASVAQVALAWLLSKNAVSSVILGATKLRQLEDNLGAIDLKLQDREIQELDEATATPLPYPNWFASNWYDKVVADVIRRG
jgi:aryl-alcohol dehydrogenase-like predicted oxidoreductase